VRDDERGALPPVLARHQVVERPLDLALGLRVEGARRLVQDQDGRVLQERAGDGDPLPLAAGEEPAPLPNPRLVTLRQRLDEAVRLGEPGGALHLRERHLWPAVGDVGADGVVEDQRLLRHERDLRAQAGERHLADVLAVDCDPAAGGIPEAGEQVRHGRLPAAGGADQGHHLALPDLERERLEDRPVSVRERDPLVLDRGAEGRERVPARVRHPARRVQDLEDPLARGGSLHGGLPLAPELLDRGVEHQHRRDEGEELARLELAREDPAAHPPDRHGQTGGGHHLHERRGEPARDEPAAQDPIEAVVGLGVAVRLPPLRAVGLHDPDPGERLLHDLQEVAAGLLGAAGHLLQLLREPHDGEEHHRHRPEGDERHAPVEHEAVHQHDGHGEAVAQVGDHRGGDGRVDRRHVGGHALEDVPGVAPRVERGREREQVVEQRPADVPDDPLAGARHQVELAEERDALQDRHRHDHERQGGEQAAAIQAAEPARQVPGGRREAGEVGDRRRRPREEELHRRAEQVHVRGRGHRQDQHAADRREDPPPVRDREAEQSEVGLQGGYILDEPARFGETRPPRGSYPRSVPATSPPPRPSPSPPRAASR